MKRPVFATKKQKQQPKVKSRAAWTKQRRDSKQKLINLSPEAAITKWADELRGALELAKKLVALEAERLRTWALLGHKTTVLMKIAKDLKLAGTDKKSLIKILKHLADSASTKDITGFSEEWIDEAGNAIKNGHKEYLAKKAFVELYCYLSDLLLYGLPPKTNLETEYAKFLKLVEDYQEQRPTIDALTASNGELNSGKLWLDKIAKNPESVQATLEVVKRVGRMGYHFGDSDNFRLQILPPIDAFLRADYESAEEVAEETAD